MTSKTDTSMTIRMNKDVKQQAQQIFSDLGLDMTTAVNVFLRQAIRYRGFPFDVTLSTPNEVTLAAMEDAVNGRDIHGPFHSVEALMEDLNAGIAKV